jgi:two-component system cell cycle sensor histidine kinase/response regulator CckA
MKKNSVSVAKHPKENGHLTKVQSDLLQARRQLTRLQEENQKLQKIIEKHRHQEKELRLSEEKYRMLFDRVPIGLYRTRPNGEIVDANPALLEILGYPTKEMLLAESPESFYLDPDDREKWKANIEDHDTVINFESRFRKLNGEVIWLKENTRTVRDTQNKVVYYEGSFEDISRRKKVEEALQYRIDFINLLTKISTKFINLPADEIDRGINDTLRTVGKFTGVDRAYVFQFSPDQKFAENTHEWCRKSIDKKIHNLKNVPSSLFPRWMGTIKKHQNIYVPNVAVLPREAKAEKKYLETQKIRSLVVVPIINRGSLIGFLGFDSIKQEKTWPEEIIILLKIVGDVISNALLRKTTEKALRKSEEKYRKFFEDDISGNYITSAAGELLFCNPAFMKIFGFGSQKEAMAFPIDRLYPAPEMREALLSDIKEKKRLLYKELELQTCDGQPVYVMANIMGNFDDRGELIEMRGYLLDITEHKKLERQLRQAQKMEAVGRLAGGVAHDFNNVLTIVKGYGDLLCGDKTLSQRQRQNLEQIIKAADRAESLTSQLLAFSRKQMIKPRIINLNDSILNVQKMLKHLIGEDIRLHTILAKDDINVKVDPGQIDQILMNLAVNSRDAMPDGGKITIETKTVDLDQEYAAQHIPIQPGPYVLLALSDTGIGMDEETKSKIFEPFFSTKKGNGTGLGLSTVYGIVKQNNGFIWVYSEPGGGATFKIYLPRMETKKPQRISRETRFDYAGTETILLVEDDEMVREISKIALEQSGYKLLVATDGRDALKVAENFEGSIDIMVTDVVMPEIGGRELAQRLSPLHPDMKILFVSGYTDNAIVEHGVLDPDVFFLQKPFTPPLLGRKVRKILDS